MKASYRWLQTYFADPLPKPEELAALLTEHVFEVEETETVGTDTIFDFKVLPDRAHYLLSHRGLAREIAVITGLSFADVLVTPVTRTDTAPARVTLENDLCRRYVTCRVDGVVGGTHASSEDAALLASLGQKSISALVDAGNVTMLETGQPVHVFDADKLVGALTVRGARDGERIELLTGETVTLQVGDLVVADEEGPVAIAGVKGGLRAGVSATTTAVVLEAANFDPTMVRRTSTRLNLRNESSKRFENEITPDLAPDALERLCARIAAAFPKATFGAVGDTYPAPMSSVSFTVTAEQVAATLGAPVTLDEIQNILKHMGCTLALEGAVLTVTPPLDRFDLALPEDIADEVGRLRGYAALMGVMPPTLAEAQSQDPLFYYGEKIKSVLVGRGYSEVLLYSFGNHGAYEIAYPLAEDKAWLRPNLSDRMVEKLVMNRRNADLLGLDTIRLCEVGQVFPEQGERAAFALGVAFAHKRKGQAPEDVIREDLHALSEALGVEVPDHTNTGAYGAICEVDLTDLLTRLPKPGDLASLGFSHLTMEKPYARIVPYPFIARDIALFVPEGVVQDDVHAVLTEHAGPLRVRSWLFDEFVKQVGDVPQHSFAFRLVFQAPDRTLEDSEINTIMDGVQATCVAKGWTVR